MITRLSIYENKRLNDIEWDRFTSYLRNRYNTYAESKHSWYRIPEREESSTNIKLKDRAYPVINHRVIAHVGYFVSPIDMPVELAKSQVEKWLTDTIKPDFQDALTTLRAFGKPLKYILSDVLFSIRNTWVAQQRKNLKGINHNLRTFWYMDTPGFLVYEESRYESIGLIKHIGTREYEPYDEDGGGGGMFFANQCQHRIYPTRRFQNMIGDEKYRMYVHPLDLGLEEK